ncbi:MAG: amylo-alpha-1,6-glucosidase [Actinobacteria bacterium]|nr:amylo-alpha-1,6-glucosidase [Actinomycetota bacterium]
MSARAPAKRALRHKESRRAPSLDDLELLVVKEGALFACSRSDGDVRAERATGEGLYFEDTRYLSELSLTLDGEEPVPLNSSAGLGHEATIELTTNPLLDVLRVRRVSAGRLYERIEIRNHGTARAETDVAITLGADFADMFEIRGVVPEPPRGLARPASFDRYQIRFGYEGVDDTLRETIVEMDPPPSTAGVSGGRVEARWSLRLEPHESAAIDLLVEPSIEGRRASPLSFEAAGERAEGAVRAWFESCREIEGLRPPYDRVVSAALRDLSSLITPFDDHDVFAAGIPWYVAPFGRDSLITAYEMLGVNPEPARATLRFLARHQATEDDPHRDAEPGKILHELRRGELARGGFIPHTPYYGSVDSTPLFVALAAEYWRRTKDLDSMLELRATLDAALRWIDEFGDLDGDGFIEYERRSPSGLRNQGWKDSDDSIVHADGALATGPIALVEAQGYVYMAKHQIAEVYAAMGDRGRAEVLRHEAGRLKKSFNDAFWMPEGTFALALDGRKNRICSVTSNPGHCLFTGIVDSDKAADVARRLTSPEVFSGWGVRTLACDCGAFDPTSYHNGSVWPHDNAIIATGLRRYGFWGEAELISAAMFDAALQAPDARLPELFCGFDRIKDVPYVPYPVACRPQAWAAAAPLMLLGI